MESSGIVIDKLVEHMGPRRDAEYAKEAQRLSPAQNTSFNCANNEYKGLLGLITSGSQKSPTFGGQLRERSVKISRKPRPVCSVAAPNVSVTLLIRNGL